MKKRIAALLLALVMAFSLIPATVFAEEDHANQVRVIVENTTFTKALEGGENPAWTGTLVDEWVALSNDSTVMTCVVAALDNHGYTQSGAENNYISSINGLAAGDGGSASGWMGTLNDWFTNEGFGGFTVAKRTLEAGDEIRIMYTSNGYGADLGGSWANNDKTVKELTFSAGTLDKDFDKDTHEYTLTVPADVTSVMVTPTASNKNFQVRTSVDGTEYKRTAAVPVADGKQIVVKCGDPEWPSMNNQADGTGATVPAETYTITVKAEGETPVTPEVKTMTVNVAPKTANVTFYSDADATTALAQEYVKDNGEVKVGYAYYHQYELSFPADLSADAYYAYRGTEGETNLGGEAFKPKEGVVLHLLRANVRYNGKSLNEEGDYTFTLQNGDRAVVCGTPYIEKEIRYTPVLLIAGEAHSGTVTLAEKWNSDYYLTREGKFSNTPSKTSGSAATINLPITTYKKITVTAPKDAAVSFFKQEKNYVVSSITADSTETDGETTTHVFKGTSAHSNYQYRATMNGKVTQAGYLKDGDAITVVFPERAPDNTASTLAYDDNSILLNIDDSKDTNELAMQVGETFKLRAFRAAWEIVNSTTANQMIEPDFHYAVLSGNDVVSIVPTAASDKGDSYCSGNASGNWMNVTALKNGTAVVAVYYDAIDVYGATPANATGITTFGASDPARYGYVVIHVGQDVTADVKPLTSDGDWDAEFDTVYYTGDEGGVFSFTSSDATAVTVKNLYAATMGAEVSAAKDADGKWNVPVKAGSNLIAITTAQGIDYRLVRAAKVTVTYTNVTTSQSDSDITKLKITQGDTLKIHVDGLHMPIPKMSGVYNPGYPGTVKVAYLLNNEFVLMSAGTQYDFVSSARSDVTFKVLTSGENKLSGYISLSSMGDDFGNHRNITDEGKPVNMNASEKFGTFGILPAVSFNVQSGTSDITYDDATSIKKLGIYVGGTNAYFNAAKFDKVVDGQRVVWGTSGTDGMYVNVTPNSYYNSMKLRYWYEGEDAVEQPLTGGVGKVISSFKRDVNKVLNLQLIITPGDASLGEAKVYNFTVIPKTIEDAEKLIKGIGDVTLDKKEAIEAARTAYDALTDAQKALVNNYETLVTAEKKLAELTNKASADDVTKMINAIGTVSKDSGKALAAARAAYNALNDEQKALVPEEVLKALEKAEADYAKLLNDSKYEPNPLKPGNNSSAKNPYQKDNKTDTKADSKDVKSGNTGDAGIALYVGMGLLAAMGGAVVIGRKKKAN